MNTIKFKAIDRYTKEVQSNPFNGKIGGINGILSDTGNWDYFVYINVNDESGVEIYTGDIIKIDSKPCFIGEVIQRFGAYGVENKGQGRYFIDISEPVHVIGHVSINPELLCDAQVIK